ncbi:pyrroline-5-carboxylate reductase [Garciella nitratireducens]|uniref:pyrroline-5-carboxylate reductase n=1 Tax=Garciella nitratireducens TaxID=218205 RepID=UPI001BD2FD76|nr:pyrroline-5-carboxylate reductase [Garciella nitratireducens]
MEKTIGFIGAGNMAKAMIGGILQAKILPPEKVFLSNPHKEKLEAMKKEFGVQITLDNKEVAQRADILVLSVKPYLYSKVIQEIKDEIQQHTILVNIAAGVSIESIEQTFAKKVKVVRVMPNTPAQVGEAMSCVCVNKEVTKEELQEVMDIFHSFGEVEVIDENLMDVATGVSGSSPAYVYLFIEALADGAVLEGMPREKAYKLAAQAVLGSAKMVLESKEHPAKLKDQVCSPGGTTIEAVACLEKNYFRSTVIQAVQTATQKSKEMGKK